MFIVLNYYLNKLSNLNWFCLFIYHTWYFIQSVTATIQTVCIAKPSEIWVRPTIQTVCIAKPSEIWVRPTIQTVCIAAAHSRAQYKPFVLQEARGFKLPYLQSHHTSVNVIHPPPPPPFLSEGLSMLRDHGWKFPQIAISGYLRCLHRASLVLRLS